MRQFIVRSSLMCFLVLAPVYAGQQTPGTEAKTRDAEPGATDVVFYLDSQGGMLQRLPLDNAHLGGDYPGLGLHLKAYVQVEGERSSFRLRAGQTMQFALRPSRRGAGSWCGLYRFEVRDGNRLAILQGKKKMKFEKTAEKPGALACTASTYGNASLKYTPSYALPAGEYGFLSSPTGMYTFGVDGP